jgi:hypothetical protein
MTTKLEEASFIFSQESNCVDPTDVEILTIECKSDLGIDNTEGCFYVIKTEQWSFDNLDELQKLLDRISKAIKL